VRRFTKNTISLSANNQASTWAYTLNDYVLLSAVQVALGVNTLMYPALLGGWCDLLNHTFKPFYQLAFVV
jgi:hypothetical protein